ncbi:MAG TPA: molybdopterin-dependent oxidoreductase [Acidimicrobiales bacterium]|nr:molybdopterin-dependent oxidoreductase [Acidimicrobiales bacterium]
MQPPTTPDRPGEVPPALARPEPAGGRPIGRRVVLGMLALGAAGIAFGKRVQDGLSRALSPQVASLLPSGGRFRIYSVTAFHPRRSEADYRLAVDGLVERPLELTFAELSALPATALTRDFQCVTGWRVADVAWRGVKVADLLDRAGARPEGAALRFYSFDGVYTESLTLDQARRDDVLVVWEMEGEGVSRAHGGPVRLLVAPMYGYKSLKWLDRIEVVTKVVPGYWEQRGYDVDAWVGRSNGRSDAPIG